LPPDSGPPREGRGQPVVCLHAVGHGGRDFDAFARAVRNDFEVIRIDWPDQGRSAPNHEPPSPARYAALLCGVVKALAIERPIVLGSSIGGTTAILYASTDPVRALVLCGPGGLVDMPPSVTRICNAFSRFFGAGARGAWWFGSAFSEGRDAADQRHANGHGHALGRQACGVPGTARQVLEGVQKVREVFGSVVTAECEFG